MDSLLEKQLQVSQSFLTEFAGFARAENVAICPVLLPAKTVELAGLVYQETFNYRSLQISLEEASEPSIDFHFDEIGCHRENELLNVTIRRPPSKFAEFWRVRQAWMRRELAKEDVGSLVRGLRNALIE